MERTVIEQLRRTIDGRVTMPEDADYDAERTTFNATIQRRPAAIVRAGSTNDVVAAVLAANDLGLPIAVRGGGHSVAGHAVADGALVVDLRDLRAVTVDPRARIARVAGGAQWDDVDAATWAHHLAVVGGTFGDTGVAGLTLGGGIGWLIGTQGLTCDNLVGAEVVTATGERVVAGADGDRELLWALRGGGGNFGVVTSFEFRLSDPGPIMGGELQYHIGAAQQVLGRLIDVVKLAPDAFEAMVWIGTGSDGPPKREAIATVGIAWSGDPGEIDRVLRPLRLDLPVLDDSVRPMSYLDLQAMNGRLPFGLRHYWKGHFLRVMDDEVVAGIAESFVGHPGGPSGVLLEAIRGVARQEPEGGAAFGQRQAAWNASALAIWEEAADDDRQIAWARATADQLGKRSLTGAGYANYAPVDETAERVRLAFGPDRFDRLVAVKRRYDPDNRFRFNLNIPPGLDPSP